MSERAVREVDVLVVGAGPAGLAAAVELRRAGVASVEVLDREQEAGGVPRHCHHTGFGVRDLHRVLTGPAYAQAWVQRAEEAGVVVRAGVTATDWLPSGPTDVADGREGVARVPASLTAPGPPRAGLASSGDRLVLSTTSPGGVETVAARAVVLATGARERPRSARLVPGDRPAGVLTTGQLQQLVYVERMPVGRRAVVVGAEHVSFSAVLTLRHAGVEPVAMVTDHPEHQSWAPFGWGARLGMGVPLLRRARVTRIVGKRRVEAVELTRDDGVVREIPCDTVVLTGDWIPDHELARRGGVAVDPGSRGPRVDRLGRTSVAGVFAVGNAVHPALTADDAALRARAVASAVVDRVSGCTWPAAAPQVVVEPPLRWLWPSFAGPSGPWSGASGSALASTDAVLWPSAFGAGWIEVHQGERLLGRWHRRLVANRPVTLPGTWLAHVDPAGPPVRVRLR